MKKITVAGVILLMSNLLMAQKKNSLPVIHAHSRTTISGQSVGAGAVAAVLNQRSSSTSTANELAKIEHEAPVYQSRRPTNPVKPEPVLPGAAAANRNKPMGRIGRPRAETAGLVTQPRSNGRLYRNHR